VVFFFYFFFFFFQAEDGIRDDLVTGVQTCALPISSRSVYLDLCGGSINLKQFIRGELDFQGSKVLVQTFKLARAGDGNNPWLLRSEERRVGKECRVGWGR